ncbi:MAG: LVIVD repeat-containing protein [Actinomycetota bacterium]
MKRRIALALALGLVAALVAPYASARPAREADASDNVKLIANFPYENEKKDFFSGGTDIDFSGKYVYAMQQGEKGGVHIIDASKATPKKVGFFPCPGGQNDVAVVKPGLIAIAYHSTQCGGSGGGVRLIDVKDPRNPKLLGAVNDLPGGTHTLTTYPGEDIIYASPGGLANGGGTQQILDVSDPNKPKVAAKFNPNGPIGCHDLAFYVTKDEALAGCAGAGEAQIWDVSDPLAPSTVAHIPVPAQFPHSFAFTHDGKYFVIGDEAIAGNDCVGGPTGSLWAYDFTVRQAPALIGHWGPKRGPLPAGSSNYNRNTWCSAHLFNFIPGTYTLVGSWYAGGMSVVDFSNPTLPSEVAHYMGTGEDITNYWSAYWYDGRIWANDRVKGLDVFTVKGLKEGKHKH